MKLSTKKSTVLPILIGLSLSLIVCTNPADNNNGRGNNSQKKDSIRVCNSTISKDGLAYVIDGDMVVVARYCEDGTTLKRLVCGLILGMAETGLDFNALSSRNLSFNDGVYSYRGSGHSIDLVFYFAQNFEGFHAGDTIPYNLFSIDSYLKNISVGVNGIAYENGPLFNLIQGSLTFNGTTPLLSISTTEIAFTVRSQGRYGLSSNGFYDSLLIKMTTTPATIQNFQQQVYAGGYGFSYDSTFYSSNIFDIVETIFGSTFYMKRLNSGSNDSLGWYWSGYYAGDVHKGNCHYYMHGLASDIQQNYTGYYCDPAFADSFGVAIHDTSLTFGHFYSVFGDTLYYLLE
ncbi:MAG TPA: hypothetical protein VLX91_15010 [Candidatus Acidoferrales bacterium]|nr:hypothetical protein [Candidatus Acidoferrales bacterium]